MSGIIVKQGDHFKVTFKYNPVIIEAVKNLPGRSFNYQDKSWMIPAIYKEAIDKFAYRYNFQFGGVIEKEIDFDIPPLPELEIDIPLKMNMFPYQKTGVAYNLLKQRTLIGDKPGLGKTVQSIATVLAANKFPCLIICPSS
jgi:SWI/SNF-related matrix-associated actin-dependent regulator 1 of chromatin subfamily A